MISTRSAMTASGEYAPGQVDLILADECSRFYADPYGWVLWAFDWGHGELQGFDGPDEWQKELLIALGNQIKGRRFDGVTPVDPIQMAVASGHGIGKSAITAWLILFILSTRPKSRGKVTANTGEQLRTMTWAELTKWTKLCIVGHWFEINSMSIHHHTHPRDWRADAYTCREENSEAFAGLHAASSTPFYLFDEAGGIPGKIWEVASGGLTDGEPMWFAFGNPTDRSGEFYNCFSHQKHRWINKHIDSRNAKMTNKTYLQKQIDDFGEDSDRVRVRVKGQFPRGGNIQFIPSDIVQTARVSPLGRYLGDDPLICGVDLARGGDDDCVIQFRRGKDAKSEKVYKIIGENSRDSMKVVAKLTMLLERHIPDVTFLDVGSMGGPIGDRLRELGYHVIDVGFGWNADNEKLYANKASEMWFRMKDWLFNGGAIVDDNSLDTELTNREYGFDKKDRTIIEPKKDMKKRIGHSPDWADALCLTFAYFVPKRDMPRGQLDAVLAVRNQNAGDYDPLGCMNSEL